MLAQQQTELVCGLNHTYFGRVERGERNVTFSVLCTLCTALGCDVAALTVGIPGRPKDPISRSAT